MPRRHTPRTHTPYTYAFSRDKKRRFDTQEQAERAADGRMQQDQELSLSVYQDIDGGWYLTRRKKAPSP